MRTPEPVIVPRHDGPTKVPEVISVPRSVKQIIEQAEQLARRFESFEPDLADRVRAKSLAALHRAMLARAKTEAALSKAVTKARADGLSWNAIGSVIGTSGEAARQRYGTRQGRRRKAV